ncbi:MAG: helix-turn-helix transcriptional regulator [Thermoanaerobaculia bacterium]
MSEDIYGAASDGVIQSMDVHSMHFRRFCRNHGAIQRLESNSKCPRTYYFHELLDSKCPWLYPSRMPRSRQPDPDAVRFGAILRRERLARGWTIVKLARRSGMHHQYLGVVEAGGNIPSLSTILEVCEVLGADAGAMIREVAEARRMPKAKTS